MLRKTVPSWIIISVIIFSIFGFADASYLTYEHYWGPGVKCSVLSGCDVVTTSSYSMIFDMPVSLFGVLYYVLVFSLAVIYFRRRASYIIGVIFVLSVLGFVMSLWFVYVQIFLIEAICLYCMGSALSSTLIFVFGTIMLYFNKKLNFLV